MIETVATRAHILKLQCNKFDFGLGCAPNPARGAYWRSPRPGGWILAV